MHRSPSRPAPPAIGLTVIDLVLALGIALALSSLSLPLWLHAVQDLRASTLQRQLVVGMATARSTAITRRQRIGLCPSADGRQCGGRWDQGWLMYRAGTEARDPADGAPVLRHEQRHPHPRLIARGSPGRPSLHFHADGRSGNSNQTVTVCSNGWVHARVIVNLAGRVRSTRPASRTPC